MNYTLKKNNQGKGKEKVNNLWFSSSRGRLLWEPQNKLFSHIHIFTVYIILVYIVGVQIKMTKTTEKKRMNLWFSSAFSFLQKTIKTLKYFIY